MCLCSGALEGWWWGLYSSYSSQILSPNSRWTVPVFKGIGENITASVFLKELILSNQTTLGAEVGGILNVQIRNNFPLPRKMN